MEYSIDSIGTILRSYITERISSCSACVEEKKEWEKEEQEEEEEEEEKVSYRVNDENEMECPRSENERARKRASGVALY
ncbi:hypothetical protein HZH68_010674 [Vespula germanica]|uniref:Uncharacterized protein n=1 Tax=Vespula germanica TaxID=30212 RepID=A0A834N249_VESGE|nr:hypothetical protein HZH68_010674 [Vespula germanica]